MLNCWLRPTKPQTALTPIIAAASNTRRMKSCFFFRIAGSWCSRLSKYPKSEKPTPVARTAASTLFARAWSNGWRRSSVLATGSSIASAGTSDSLGWSAADNWT